MPLCCAWCPLTVPPSPPQFSAIRCGCFAFSFSISVIVSLLSLSLCDCDSGARWSTHLSTAPRSRTLHPLEAYVEHWPQRRQLVPYHQAAIVAKSRRLSVVTFPIPRSLFRFFTSPFLHSPLQFPMFILLESHFAAACAKLPAGVCILRAMWIKSLTVKCGYLVNRAALSRCQHNSHSVLELCFYFIYKHLISSALIAIFNYVWNELWE